MTIASELAGASNYKHNVGRGPFPLRRLGRRLFWTHPKLYRWIGIARQRGDCLQSGFDLWMGGYPRSANTFALAALKLCNPAVEVASHLHFPPHIIYNVRKGVPGIFLIRRPADCVVSFTLYLAGSMRLERTLEYYLDFHRALRGYRSKLLIAPFEDTVSRFEQVLHNLNERFGTSYVTRPPDGRSFRECLSIVEDWIRSPDGPVDELMVCRPSPKRASLKPKLLEALRSSPALKKRLDLANALYDEFTYGLPRRAESNIVSKEPMGAEFSQKQ